ncbi:putative holin [Mycobacterium phage PP]|uniref:Holin n=1 Tax=Mycobacterium phage PP TaxID=2077134 RepID=A0A2Z5XVD7_9CAUD|nr:holin [Mycobacterium phage PP]BBC53813.1 putative holin [Mycobacterium phage PP]
MSPKISETIYHVGTVVTGLIGIGLVWGGIDAGAAAHIGDILAGIATALAAGAPATAAVRVRRQSKDGLFDEVPPADAVVNGVQAVIAAQQTATAELDRVKQAVTSAVGVVPGLGPLAAQIINSSVVGSPTEAYSLWSDRNAAIAPYNR